MDTSEFILESLVAEIITEYSVMSEASKFFLTKLRIFSLAKSFKPSQKTGETQVILACAFNNKLIFLRAISPPPTTRHGF